MKKLKYILFSILLSFVFINYANAEEVCNFSYNTLKFTCKLVNNEVSCSYIGAYKENMILEEVNLIANDIISCEKISLVSIYENHKNYLYLYSKDTANIPKNSTELQGEKVKLAKHNGKSCSYNMADLQYKCIIENGMPNCKLVYVNNIPSYHFIIDNNKINVLTAKDFLNGDNFVCPTGSNNSLYMCGSKNGDINNVSYVGKDCGEASDLGALTYNQYTSSGGSSNNANGNQNSGNSGNSGNSSTPSNPSGSNNPNGGSNTVYTPTSFCEKETTKGAFRVLGWAIYIIKIVIPIILIVLGSIDVAKAVIASKDDELKKSIKTLAIRVVAGVIVFFIPTLLNFIVNMINGDSIYDSNSGFGYCTHCILEPTDDACGSLMGGN